MKTKAHLILKSLEDLPANTLALAGSVPVRAMEITKRALTPTARATRREIRAARRRSLAFMQAVAAKAQSAFLQTQAWSRGGLNE